MGAVPLRFGWFVGNAETESLGHNREKLRFRLTTERSIRPDDSNVKWFLTQLVVLLQIEAFWHALATVGIGSTYWHLFLKCVQLVELAF